MVDAEHLPDARDASTHRAARIEDWFHGHRERCARRHGRVPSIIPYTGYGSVDRVRVLCRVLLVKPVQPPSDPPTAADRRRAIRREQLRGWRSFISSPVAFARVRIEIDGHETEVVADRGGVVDIELDVSLTPGWHVATLTTDDGRSSQAPVQVIPADCRFGVVSDVDDTVMVTMLPRPFLAGWNTFVLNEHARIPTPGMAVLMERLATAHPGAPVVYLSTGAWNVAPALTRFLSRNLYPSGPLLLTDWGPTHDRWFRSGRAHKHDNLQRLAREFPDVRWLLIGDDGQRDEEIYREFAAENPQRVAAVAIRQLSPGEAVLAGGRSKNERPEHPQIPWVYAPDGSGLAAQLEPLGLL
ncbi:phosphatase domain-containing protein [Rathayibacter sp. YIM 133350]|uniref:App1 family protein n=1 Tax=Rathayibacter sp. YIM 133350 TaxID=3131992 RepID=UPI00307FBABB